MPSQVLPSRFDPRFPRLFRPTQDTSTCFTPTDIYPFAKNSSYDPCLDSGFWQKMYTNSRKLHEFLKEFKYITYYLCFVFIICENILTNTYLFKHICQIIFFLFQILRFLITDSSSYKKRAKIINLGIVLTRCDTC